MIDLPMTILWTKSPSDFACFANQESSTNNHSDSIGRGKETEYLMDKESGERRLAKACLEQRDKRKVYKLSSKCTNWLILHCRDNSWYYKE